MNSSTLSLGLPAATMAVFIALAILSVLALTVTIFKIMQFRRIGVGKSTLADQILDDWLNGRPDEAMRKASKGDGVLQRVLHAVMSGLRARPNDPSYAEELGRQSALVELSTMAARMRLLEAVVQAAPMLGLLGTVIGMIDAFSALSQATGAVDPSQLAGGIWTALTTTAIGLAIALVAYFVANWLESQIDTERQEIEMAISAAIHGRVAGGGRR
ncbi:MotA/TolQ/ExbB proton channel family protein [Paracoccus tegillarcae]|uniref:MotA/TolQ/ExbB proton channel family protein n=1 Tax=Paracoccus tegillarcae TaxID=1529068 RepID=A0A2K9EDD4_9RHOB|nr:MotA/TolQ/ExbB proton channel family protein [Paracoccus tegillarcae]AUH32940.1 MotA/TolQ/ExbB proton channel family protein [Paracoccus tegillarcae]